MRYNFFIILILLLSPATPVLDTINTSQLAAAEETYERILLTNGDTLVGRIVSDNGKIIKLRIEFGKSSFTRSIPVSRIAERGVITAEEAAAASMKDEEEKKPAAAKIYHKEMLQNIGGSLVDAKDRKIPAQNVATKPYLVFYFTASWCPPCRKFSPKLVKYYNDAGESRDFEIIVVSSDRSRGDMMKYMSKYKMPFPGLKHSSKAEKNIKSKYSGSGIPSVTVIGPDGKVVADSYKGKKYLGPYFPLQEMEKHREANPQ